MIADLTVEDQQCRKQDVLLNVPLFNCLCNQWELADFDSFLTALYRYAMDY